LFSAEDAPGHSSDATKDAIVLSGFLLAVLDSLAPDSSWRPQDTVKKAVDHYLVERTLRPPGWACLPLPENAQRVGGGERTLTMEIGDRTMEELRAEAVAQGVSLEALVAHAVTYLWAAEHPREAVAPTASARRPRAGNVRRDDRSRT
jgi:hypothetical protein